MSIATIAFDTSLEDILTGITNGIKIIFADDIEIKNIVDLINLIKENQPEVMEFTPSRLLSYLEIEEFCNVIGCGKCIVMGGEQFSAKAFNGVKQYTNAKVYNSYGPTEATIIQLQGNNRSRKHYCWKSTQKLCNRSKGPRWKTTA